MRTRMLALRTAAVAAVAAAGFGLTALASGGGDHAPVRMVPNAHGGEIRADVLQRVSQAASAEASTGSQAALAARGERLFNSSALAKPGEACVSCHVLGGAVNGDLGVIRHTRDASKPVDGDGNFVGDRQPPALWDVAETAPYNWIGSAKTLEDQATMAVDTHFKSGPAAGDVAAIAAYLRTIKAPVTRHDQGRLTQEELAGEEVFVGKGGCVACHGGPQFTDNLIHDTGVPQPTIPNADDADPGAKGVPHGFNTPTLLDIRNTAPYMHNGSLKTLSDVIVFYDSNARTAGPNGLKLTTEEISALVAYLKTL